MDTKKLDKLAYAGGELPDGLDAAESLYFLSMRAVYQFAGAGKLDPEQGKREKGRIIDLSERYAAVSERQAEREQELARREAAAASAEQEREQMGRRYQEVITATERCRRDYRKARNVLSAAPWELISPAVRRVVEVADALLTAFDNVPPPKLPENLAEGGAETGDVVRSASKHGEASQDPPIGAAAEG